MPQPKKLINSLHRAMTIVDLFTEKQPAWKLSEISRELELNKSTVHGLLKTLMHHGYIAQDPESEKYKLGLRFAEKGHLVMAGLDVRRVATPFLQEITDKYGDATHLAVLDGGEAVYIEKIEGRSAIGMYSRVGKRAPLYCTAVGKVLASGESERVIQELATHQTYTTHTEHTIKNIEEFITSIHHVAKQGYALDDEELELGLRCMAVPIYDRDKRILAAMSISGPIARITKADLPTIISDLKAQAQKISVQLGY
ncbi:IclR family transcriptional regulator [Paenalkalicoccus suaedae]|uniref:Glycerol operon regulatory protein n=1 Tax=Paenalkalicoccus suaedae TaxID=2592382 RepID=A0A859FIL7_9BACI|nr:IclR family transcriptional regulator [Paenalkalicoccus suaedae]QKS72728.1 IclR family transcriptional regulator [Paenalkalicoccus suaedae]